MSRFSQLYLTRGEPLQDSERFRNRLGAFCWQELTDNEFYKVCNQIEAELGVDVPYYGTEKNLAQFFKSVLIRDVLDSITEIWRSLKEIANISSKIKADKWAQFVSRVFQEENLSYTIDKKAIVHYQVDKAFEQERLETLKWLSDKKYNAVKVEFEKSQAKLAEHSPDTKAAVRAIFESLEILARLFDNGISRLGPTEVTRSIRPKVEVVYSGDTIALDSAKLNLAALSDWINSVQIYRHGQAVTEPAAPPLGLAVLIVAQGTAFLRWLLEIYQANGEQT